MSKLKEYLELLRRAEARLQYFKQLIVAAFSLSALGDLVLKSKPMTLTELVFMLILVALFIAFSEIVLEIQSEIRKCVDKISTEERESRKSYNPSDNERFARKGPSP